MPDEYRRTMTIDRQRGREGDVPHWWCNVRSWQRSGSSRQLFFGRLETIDAVRDLQLRYKVQDSLTWQDAAWDAASVYADCARFGWVAVFGAPKQNLWRHPDGESAVMLPYSQLQTVPLAGGRRARYMHWGVTYCKDILANLIAGRASEWLYGDDLPEPYRKQLEAEHRVEEGPGVWRWERIGKLDNHHWDTEAMQVVQGVLMRVIGGPVQVPPP